MTKLTIALTILLASTMSCSVAYSTQKPAAKVSRISFLLKHRAPEQHKDRISHGRK
ncbi:MAG TPA: hypothetical protein VN933_05410 [Candidatus Eremiobacteraceae bacterium]|jgi:hypothetical protein|nr:hypothetical protein [Candidatus Eremiobacteraceae bacterium]